MDASTGARQAAPNAPEETPRLAVPAETRARIAELVENFRNNEAAYKSPAYNETHQCGHRFCADNEMTSMKPKIEIPKSKIADFCRSNHIRKFAFFGSVLRSDFRPDSDIDVLVEFEPGHVPGFIRLARMERELSEMLGRKADLRTPEDLSRYFRDDVIAEAEVQYAA
jgi:predicted nucleotidyltransferase